MEDEELYLSDGEDDYSYPDDLDTEQYLDDEEKDDE